MQSSYSNIYFSWLVTVILFLSKFCHIVLKAQVRYDNEYIDGLLSLSVHIFKEVYISSCDQI